MRSNGYRLWNMPSSAVVIRPIGAVLAGGLVAILTGCAAPSASAPTPAATASLPTDEEAINSLRSGAAALDCGAPCAEEWSRNRPELAKRYRAGDWRGLAILTMRTNYREDLAFYYLGRAAEGLGGGNAALSYYRTALSLTTGTAAGVRCVETPASCDGVSLPNDEVLHIQIAQTLLSRHASTGHHGTVAQPGADQQDTASPPSAPAGTWIDPPPTSQ